MTDLQTLSSMDHEALNPSDGSVAQKPDVMSSTPPSLPRRQSTRLSEDTSVTASTGNGQHDIPQPPCSARQSDPRNGLETFDWEGLDARFQTKMSKCAQAEQAIYTEFGTWIRLFEAWASTTSTYENERAYKRLRTRMTFVNGAEERLEKRKKHHQEVVKAFQNALMLLGSS